ncbi:6-phospho-beta-glucosidase [Cellulomonas alba]|uniref:6-phospho-beta-glucosidase n=1 Tax=Cellulomonas alba TaxID=3053467 RepID=A0ABT7SGI5_9CELL|nr:6-phospho-beta-glucosidase [Cellulomonas alba]MDM7855256.1 6-phospho-beta-glucosidase [Cellulomonas alba]
MRLTVVGGGSTYTPELVDGFARLRAVLPLDELCLVDPDAGRLSLVAGVSQRMFARAGYPVRVTTTSDLAAGVDGAAAVLLQLRIGGQAARHSDETFPHACGCLGQETTGPGGLAKALRTVPVALDIAEVVRRHAAPEAWIVDFTNPVGIVTRALLSEGHRAVGLCNVAIGFQRRFAALLGVAPDQVALDHVGLNHLTWERAAVVDGVDRLPGLLARHLDELAAEVELAPSLLALLGCVPSYYLRYYYAHDEVLAEQLAPGARSRAQAVMDVEAELLALYADPAVDTKPEPLTRRGGAFYSEAAVDLLASLTAGDGDVRVVNVRNDGTLPFLPDDHVVEVPAVVGPDGIRPVAVAPLDAGAAGLVAHVAGYERLALEAAVHGGRDRVVRALLAHPLVGQHDRASRLADLLLAANARHLAWAR